MDDAFIIGERITEKWPKAEKRIVDRCAKLFNDHGDKMFLRCGHPLCSDSAIRLQKAGNGEMVLRCGCRDRLFTTLI